MTHIKVIIVQSACVMRRPGEILLSTDVEQFARVPVIGENISLSDDRDYRVERVKHVVNHAIIIYVIG